MALEINQQSVVVCGRCGKGYPRRKGNFMVSYAQMHRGTGYLPICNECLQALYADYYNTCNSPKDAVRQVCRKLDLFWNERSFAAVENKSTSRSIMSLYLARINTVHLSGKSYDDTLEAEGKLWDFTEFEPIKEQVQPEANDEVDEEEEVDVDDSIKEYWGPGYTPNMYMQLEQRRQYWMSRIPEDVEIDIVAEATIKQICSLEIDINMGRAAGRSVEKNITALNSLLGNSAMKKIIVNRSDAEDNDLAKTPLGVWLFRYENEKPLPEIDEKYKDRRGLLKYIFTWMGHLCRMLGIKNSYSDLYEAAIEEYKVEKPEYDGDDDEVFMHSYLSDGDDI